MSQGRSWRFIEAFGVGNRSRSRCADARPPFSHESMRKCTSRESFFGCWLAPQERQTRERARSIDALPTTRDKTSVQSWVREEGKVGQVPLVDSQ